MKPTAQRLAPLGDHFFATLNHRIAVIKAAGGDVIRLDAGSPDLPPAAHIIEVLARSAECPENHAYQPYNGTSELRQAWAGMYSRLYDINLDTELEILPLLGSKEGLFNLTQALVDPGAVVLVPDPAYLTYAQAALFAGGIPYYMPLLSQNDYLPDLKAIPVEVAQHARLLWLNYPNNPTAATANRDFFAYAVEFARQHDLLLCHDAAYAQVTFEDYHPPSLLEIPGAMEVGVEFNTLSKSHNMAGWRSGVAVGNRQALAALNKVKVHADSGHFRPILDASAAALTGNQDWLVGRNEIYRQRREVVLARLGEMGLQARTPRATLYVWFAAPPSWSSVAFAELLLEKACLSLVPGSIFGEHGEGYLRLSFTAPLERLEEAMQRMAGVVRTIR